MALGLAAVARFICKAAMQRVGEVFALFMFSSWMCVDVRRHLGNESQIIWLYYAISTGFESTNIVKIKASIFFLVAAGTSVQNQIKTSIFLWRVLLQIDRFSGVPFTQKENECSCSSKMLLECFTLVYLELQLSGRGRARGNTPGT